MPLTVADLDTLEAYLAGLMHRSDHHAQTVGAVALALIGAVLWRKGPGANRSSDSQRKCRQRPMGPDFWSQICSGVQSCRELH